MANIQLSCNLQSCRKKIHGQALVTMCSHIFCFDHFQDMTSHKDHILCMACGTELNEELDFARNGLNPSDKYKAIVLAGLNPDQVIEIATRAISFFVYQLNYDNLNKEKMLKHRKEQLEELKHYCETLTNKFKADVSKQQRVIDELKIDLEEKMRETDRQQQTIVQHQRENAKLKTQIEAYKQEIIHVRTHRVQNSPFRNHGVSNQAGINLARQNTPMRRQMSPFHFQGPQFSD